MAAAMPLRASLLSDAPCLLRRANSALVVYWTSSGRRIGAEAIQKAVSMSKEAVAAARGRRSSMMDRVCRLMMEMVWCT